MVISRPLLRVPPAIAIAIAAAWGLALLAQLTGSTALLHHDRLIEGGIPLWIAAVVFLVTWQAMIAAMMLPSSLPLIRLFTIASANQPRPAQVQLVFLMGYAAVWTLFGIGAFGGDLTLHRLVDSTPWIAARAAFIPAAILLLVGAFQFSALKDRCLKKCRLPSNFLVQHYKRGLRAAFSIGARHGAFCVGCCWALMLLGFAAGSANLAWMALLTAIMVYEKTGRYGQGASRVFGVVFLAWGGAMLVHAAG